MARGETTGIVVIKNDALEDGIDREIINFIDSRPRLTVVTAQYVELRPADVLTMYAPELADDPSERREILIALCATAMRGLNAIVGVDVMGARTASETFAELNALKGKTNEREDVATIRGRFPYSRPEGYEDLSFWFRAPFFVRNRVHVPDSVAALDALESVLVSKGLSAESLYGEVR